MGAEDVLEGVLEVEEIVMVVAAATLGKKEDGLESPESDGLGVVTSVEALWEEKTEASMVSESLSSGMEFVEEADDDGRDRSLDSGGKTGLTGESGV